MTDFVKNWILKGNNDFKTGKDEMATEGPATDTICFHMQQYVEKYLKAYLTFHKVDFRKGGTVRESGVILELFSPKLVADNYDFPVEKTKFKTIILKGALIILCMSSKSKLSD